MVSGAGPSGGAAHSASTGASASVSTPASESTVARRLNGLDLQGDDAPSSQPAASKKKKRGARAVGPDKNGRGLRQFSMRVCEKVESKGRTTYNECKQPLNIRYCHRSSAEDDSPPKFRSNPHVFNRSSHILYTCVDFQQKSWYLQKSADIDKSWHMNCYIYSPPFEIVADELVAEFSDPNINIDSPDPDNPSAQQYDEKNIRRRVYDALNVLMAMEIISKDKKEIQWRGLPKTSMNDIEELKTEVLGLKSRIDKKNAYLQDLQDQYVCLQNLVRRNEELYGSGDAPSGGVALPFILVQTRPHATVEVEISEDMQLVHFDFNSTPFELQDDSFVLKAMGLSGKEETDCTHAPVVNGGECSSTRNNYWHQSPKPPGPRGVRVPNSPPIPGILKGRVKHEH